MIIGFTLVQVAVAGVAALMCIALGLAGRVPNDLTMGALLLVELLLIAQLVTAIIAPSVGNDASGSLLEFYTYQVSVLLVPPAAVFWALVDRSRWATVILGAGCLTVGIMVYRMQQIWGA
ncbi:hypothetical protein [Paramicrobacterium chengjingii]|uniref:Integral membrane protein n=1 Tax=Paramicrobacterium chengjingii TaxID=2769067 RepID=A0ABX6YEG9_9MICO|nr:hypothetical protein [Microbacterium chengjingii]QPZ37196.1 hypothetical protein HCR76_10010 [Microbacterium chengjingii]